MYFFSSSASRRATAVRGSRVGGASTRFDARADLRRRCAARARDESFVHRGDSVDARVGGWSNARACFLCIARRARTHRRAREDDGARTDEREDGD